MSMIGKKIRAGTTFGTVAGVILDAVIHYIILDGGAIMPATKYLIQVTSKGHEGETMLIQPTQIVEIIC